MTRGTQRTIWTLVSLGFLAVGTVYVVRNWGAIWSTLSGLFAPMSRNAQVTNGSGSSCATGNCAGTQAAARSALDREVATNAGTAYANATVRPLATLVTYLNKPPSQYNSVEQLMLANAIRAESGTSTGGYERPFILQ